MGMIYSSFVDTMSYLYGKRKARILMFGIEAVGKTTILYKLKLGQVVEGIPTSGFNVETVDYNNISYTIWDIGYSYHLMPLYRHYYIEGTHIIFVIDSTEQEPLRIELARDFLHNVLTAEKLPDAVVLILLNKQDLPEAMSVPELTEKLQLDKFANRKLHIQPTSAITGEGISEGLDWMSNTLFENK